MSPIGAISCVDGHGMISGALLPISPAFDPFLLIDQTATLRVDFSTDRNDMEIQAQIEVSVMLELRRTDDAENRGGLFCDGGSRVYGLSWSGTIARPLVDRGWRWVCPKWVCPKWVCLTWICQMLMSVSQSGCVHCHRPNGQGLENAHPYGEIDLSCVDCHGGNPDEREDAEAAHQPSGDS